MIGPGHAKSIQDGLTAGAVENDEADQNSHLQRDTFHVVSRVITFTANSCVTSKNGNIPGDESPTWGSRAHLENRFDSNFLLKRSRMKCISKEYK